MRAGNAIVVSGAREHNLKDISLAIPRDALVVITGLSGSGKSSLAFDTIYAEGQRRYVESLSAYARQISGQSAEQIIDQVMELPEGTRFMVLAPIVRGRKGEYGKLLDELRTDGFARLKIDDRVRMLDESIVLDKRYKHDISVVVDRLVMQHDLRKRLADSIEAAVGLADGLVEIEIVGSGRSASARGPADAGQGAGEG